MVWQRSVLVGVGFLAIGLTHCVVQPEARAETPVKTLAAERVASADEISGWVRELGSDVYKARESASAKLFAAGDAAGEMIAKAAGSEDAEVQGRAAAILRRWLLSDDPPQSALATSILKRLSDGNDGPASAIAHGILEAQVRKAQVREQLAQAVLRVDSRALR